MAAGQLLIEPPKSTPDIGKLNSMTGRIVQVTRHTSKTGPGQLVVAPQRGVSVERILDLQSSLQAQHGPGTYRFEVAEDGGSEKDVWTVRLGAEPQQTQNEVITMATQSTFPATVQSLGPGLVDLGHGYVYNETTRTLTTPRKNIYAWEPGQPLPLESGPAAAVPIATAPSTPVQQLPLSFAGLGGGNDDRVRQLEEQLREQRNAQREAESRTQIERMIDDNNKRFEALVAKLSDRPSGPSPTEQALMEKLAAAERRMEDERREREAREREERIRNEMRQMQENFTALIRELKDNTSRGPDPTLALLSQVIQSNQQSTADTVKAIHESTKAQAETAKSSAAMFADRFSNSVLTPERLMEIMRGVQQTTQGVNGEFNKGTIDVMQSLFTMQQQVVNQMMQAQGGDAAPVWLGPLQQGIEQIGALARVVLAKRPPQVAPPPQPRQVAPTPPVQQIAPAAHAPAPRQAPAAAPAAEEAPAQPAPRRKRNVNGSAANGAHAMPPTSAPAPKQEPLMPDAVLDGPPRPATKEELEQEKQILKALSEKEPHEVEALIGDMQDEEFFGPFWEHVQQLRAAEMEPSEVASMVMLALREGSNVQPRPIVLQLIDVGHTSVVVDRLLPGKEEDYREALTESLTEQIQSATA